MGKENKDERLLESFRIMVSGDFKDRVKAMCDARGVTVSDMTREYWEAQVAEYELEIER